MTRIRLSLAAAVTLALAAFATGASAYDGKPVARYHLENAWPKAAAAPGALADLPQAPAPDAARPQTRANDRLRAAGPKSESTAWHESVLNGDIVAARKSVPANGEGKYTIKRLPGRPK
jgi:hypothetical protein